MKVAIIVPSLKDLAPVNIAISIGKHLVQSGHSVTVYYLRNTIEISLFPDIEFKKLSFFGKFNWNTYDLVHSHMLRPDIFVFFRKPLKSKTKTVSTIHNYLFSELKNYYNLIISILVGSCWLLLWMRFDKLVVLTDHAADYYKKLVSKNKIIRIFNGRDVLIDGSIIALSHEISINKMKEKYLYVIGAYCALIRRKGIHILLLHLSRVNTGCLIVIGDGVEMENLKMLVTKFNLSERVLFLGRLKDAHQYNLLFDLFAFPSKDEGFGISLIEAAIHKKKIICSNIPVFKELFSENEVTFFDINNELTIDNAILKALVNENNCLRAHEKAKTYYSENVMGSNYELLFLKLINNSN